MEEVNWEVDNEISNSVEVSAALLSDSMTFARFLDSREVRLITQMSPLRALTDNIPVDFVYNLRMSDGMNSCGWHGAGFLDGKLKYTGFTAYHNEHGMMCAERSDFLGKEVRNVPELKKAIRDYYGEHFGDFERALDFLPEYINGDAKRLFL